MTNGMNIGITGFKQNSYGNIQRIGATENGRTIYRVIDSEGKEAGRLSVASADTDKFESAYKDIMDAAQKIQKYVEFLKTNEEFETEFFEIGDRISISRKKSVEN